MTDKSDGLNWCQQSTKVSDLPPMQMQVLHYLVEYMRQELKRLTDLNNEYETYLKEIKQSEQK